MLVDISRWIYFQSTLFINYNMAVVEALDNLFINMFYMFFIFSQLKSLSLSLSYNHFYITYATL